MKTSVMLASALVLVAGARIGWAQFSPPTFDQLDKDGNGSLSKQEVADFFAQFQGERAAGRPAAGAWIRHRYSRAGTRTVTARSARRSSRIGRGRSVEAGSARARAAATEVRRRRGAVAAAPQSAFRPRAAKRALTPF